MFNLASQANGALHCDIAPPILFELNEVGLHVGIRPVVAEG
jgi:hypothetical protein